MKGEDEEYCESCGYGPILSSSNWATCPACGYHGSLVARDGDDDDNYDDAEDWAWDPKRELQFEAARKAIHRLAPWATFRQELALASALAGREITLAVVIEHAKKSGFVGGDARWQKFANGPAEAVPQP